MNKILTSILVLSTALLFHGCTSSLEEPTPTAGNADFSTYLAVGNSLTAGFSDDGLTRDFQMSSFPNMLATQMSAAGGGEFKQPLLPEGTGSGPLFLAGLEIDQCGSPSPDLQRPTVDPAIVNENGIVIHVPEGGPFNNLGVPGMGVFNVTLPPTGGTLRSDPYLPRLLNRDADENSYVDLVTNTSAALQPTFFSLWLGANDVLLHSATGGGHSDGPCEGVNPLLRVPTPIGAFTTNYLIVLDAILASNPDMKGVLLTVPDITSLPFFTTVGFSATNPENCSEIPMFYLRDGEVDTVRQGDYIPNSMIDNIGRVDLIDIMGTPTPIPHGLHPANPLCDGEILDYTEFPIVAEATKAYNDFIKATAAERGLAVADIAARLQEIVDAPGGEITIDGIDLSTGFLTGGAFGLDGVHPSDRGYAVICNWVIDAVNETYGSTLNKVDITEYTGIDFGTK